MHHKSGMTRPVTKGKQTTGQPAKIPQGNRYLTPPNPWGKGPY